MHLRRLLLAVSVLALPACTCGGQDGSNLGIKPAANDGNTFTAPFDSTPSPDGKTVFFTAVGTDGEAAVFRAAATGGGSTQISTAPLAMPSGITISTDGKMVYVADPAPVINTQDGGALFAVPADGGAPEVISGTEGYTPRGLVLMREDNKDQIYFTGTDPTDGLHGLFKVPAAGGTVTVLAKGDPFTDPHGVAVTHQGVAYVVDSSGGDHQTAIVIEVKKGTATVFQDGLQVGFPAGIALTGDDSVYLVSARDPQTRMDAVVRTVIASKQTASFSKEFGIDQFNEPAGLHRAANAEVYSWADSSANDTGTVYVLQPEKK